MLVQKGVVQEFEECPAHFIPVEEIDEAIDFFTAGEAELMERKWSFEEAHEAILAKYQIELKREEGTKKSDVVSQILDARFRSVE